MGACWKQEVALLMYAYVYLRGELGKRSFSVVSIVANRNGVADESIAIAEIRSLGKLYLNSHGRTCSQLRRL